MRVRSVPTASHPHHPHLHTPAQGLKVVTAGNLVRAEIKKGAASERSRALRRIVEAGGLVPDEIMLPLVAEGLPSGSDSSGDSDGGYILDGFPRTAAQARTLDAMLAARGLGPIQRAVNIVLADWVRTYACACLRLSRPDPLSGLWLPRVR